MNDLAIRGTAWLSLVAWGTSEWLRASDPSPHRSRARLLFTLGALALLVHTGVALHLRHGWSQADAWREIARQTEAMTGLAFGGGLLINYAFALFWLVEAAWWWRAPAGYLARSATARRLSRAVFAFMFVNGAIVFAHGPMRIAGTIVMLAVFASWYGRGGGLDDG